MVRSTSHLHHRPEAVGAAARQHRWAQPKLRDDGGVQLCDAPGERGAILSRRLSVGASKKRVRGAPQMGACAGRFHLGQLGKRYPCEAVRQERAEAAGHLGVAVACAGSTAAYEVAFDVSAQAFLLMKAARSAPLCICSR